MSFPISCVLNANLLQINETIIVPGAGMLSMAVEAVKQLVDSDLTLTGFKFKNVNFMSALVVPAGTSGVDIRLSMRPQNANGSDSNGWYEFSLFSNKGSWDHHSIGLIQAVVEKDGKPAVQAGHSQLLTKFHRMTEGSSTLLDCTAFYKSLKSSSIQFGPSFECISKIATNQTDQLVSEIRTYTSEGQMAI